MLLLGNVFCSHRMHSLTMECEFNAQRAASADEFHLALGRVGKFIVASGFPSCFFELSPSFGVNGAGSCSPNARMLECVWFLLSMRGVGVGPCCPFVECIGKSKHGDSSLGLLRKGPVLGAGGDSSPNRARLSQRARGRAVRGACDFSRAGMEHVSHCGIL